MSFYWNCLFSFYLPHIVNSVSQETYELHPGVSKTQQSFEHNLGAQWKFVQLKWDSLCTGEHHSVLKLYDWGLKYYNDFGAFHLIFFKKLGAKFKLPLASIFICNETEDFQGKKKKNWPMSLFFSPKIIFWEDDTSASRSKIIVPLLETPRLFLSKTKWDDYKRLCLEI